MATVNSLPVRARVRARLHYLPRLRRGRLHAHLPTWRPAVVVAGDIVTAAAAWIAGMLVTRVPDVALPFLTVVVIAWPVLLGLRGAYEARALGSRGEFARVGRCFVELIAVIAVGTVVLDSPTPHLGAMVAFVVLPAGSLVTRYLVLRRMRMLRRQGIALRRILAVGTGFGVTNLVDLLSAGTEHELVVVGACAEGTGSVVEDVPVIARLPDGRVDAAQPADDDAVERVLAAVDEVRADTVCVTGCSQFTGARLRTLSWALAERRVDLMAVPGLVEVATHRIQFARAGATTLLHVHPVSVTGLRGALKHVTDRVVAGALLVLLLPLLLGIGAVVRLTSPGAALFRHTRVGAGGRPFTMLKFRTMRDGAHAIRDELLDSNEHDGLMFKLRDDPRITPVGRVLRRLSVDELPQLVNVLCGQMSLVGPRPPLPDEVAAYNQVEGRRLLVKPGMTGLWQVNGRSDLTWEETLRLDLRYVDNWSLGLDARLLWRTGRAVIRGTGAY